MAFEMEELSVEQLASQTVEKKVEMKVEMKAEKLVDEKDPSMAVVKADLKVVSTAAQLVSKLGGRLVESWVAKLVGKLVAR